jgi:hypothetical protein
MTQAQVEFAGLALMGFGAFTLIAAFCSGRIPTRWPFQPITRENRPGLFWAWVGFATACILLGFVVAIAGATLASATERGFRHSGLEGCYHSSVWGGHTRFEVICFQL